MTIRPELLDELLKDYQTPQDLFGENGIIKQFTKGMIERCLQTEMEEHLGYPMFLIIYQVIFPRFCCKNFNLIKMKDVLCSLFSKNREKMHLFLQ